MRELLLKLLVEHGDREFAYNWESRLWMEARQRDYLDWNPKKDSNFDQCKITPAGLEFLQQTNNKSNQPKGK